MTEVEGWSPERVCEALEKGEIVLIDVRTPQEYLFEHIAGALLAPMAFTKPKALPSQGAKRIVLHCGSGMRSEKVAKLCLEAGFDRIAHMEGGLGAWKKANLPYTAIDPASGAPKSVNS